MDDVKESDDKKEIPAIKKKIGKTTYEVSMHFSSESKKCMEDKIMRLIENECDNIK